MLKLLKNLPIFTYIKIGAAAIAATIIGAFYFHYTSMKANLAEEKSKVVQLEAELEETIAIANDNAEQLVKAEEQHVKSIEALENAQELTLKNIKNNEIARNALNSASEEDDGSVSTLLQNLRQQRFGGDL